MSTSKKEIERIVRKHPTELKYLFKSPIEDKKRLTKIISHLVPYRVGLEFETFGSITEHFVKFTNKSKKSNNGKTKKYKNTTEVFIKKKFRLFDFNEDFKSWSDVKESDGQLNEIRISVLGYKGLIPLFDSLETLNLYCSIPTEKGGIHIHIDFPELKNDECKDYALDWFDRLSIQRKVLQIFGGYKGEYNSKGSSTQKGHYIRVSDLNTIEFRIGRLTYDYKTIIRWIISCSELVRRCKSDYFNKVYYIGNKAVITNKYEFSSNLADVPVNNTTDYYIAHNNDQLTDMQCQIDELRRFIINSNGYDWRYYNSDYNGTLI